MAADQGDEGAQAILGALYYRGQGVPQDYIQAYMWINLAAANGAAPAIKFRDVLAGMMTPGQIAEAQRLAREWKPKRAGRERSYRPVD
jgi:TPR repeat protein